MQTSWIVHGATEEWALKILESQGAQALEEKVKADLATHAALGKALLHPAYHPPVPPPNSAG